MHLVRLPTDRLTGPRSTGTGHEKNVLRLQARIVKAAGEGRWGKVRCLQHLLTHSYGFRKGRSTHDAIGRCFQLQSKRASPKWILDCDVKSCFDEISHEWLVRYVLMENRVLHKWLVAGFMDKSVFHPTVAGTPQGG